MQYSDDEEHQLNILKTMTRKKLQDHFNEFYTKNNMLFIISTGIDKDVVLKKLKILTNKCKKVKSCSYKISRVGLFSK